MTALLTVAAVGYVYPSGIAAVGDVSLGVLPGQVISIIGPSGCGKSTLLAMIAGLNAPSHGTIEWSDATRDTQSRRRFTVVFQRDTLLPWLTVERNIEFGLKYVAITREEKKGRVDQLLAMSGLTRFRTAYPRELSGGMRRRTALLVGIAPLPHMLLLDEPFSALDEPTRVSLHEELLMMVRRFNMAVLLVTHDLGEAISLSDTVLTLSRAPCVIASSRVVPFGAERDIRSIREVREYQDLYAELWSGLRRVLEEDAGGSAPGTGASARVVMRA